MTRAAVATPDNPQPEPVDLAELESLSSSNRQLLHSMVEALGELHPQPGTLHDLPQVTVNADELDKACRIAKDSPLLNANQLMCLACVDYQENFQLVYFLRSLKDNGEPAPTMVIKGVVPYDQPRAPSVVSVWRAAEWYEREAHDLFGVTFEGHPNLSPLLLYEGFEGYPGRKEFPLNEYQEF